jgi:drug/metabolite transporter (DMT)-like permease
VASATVSRGGAAPPQPLDARDLTLYAATVFVWGTSWIAIRMQLGVVAPEVSTLWRFLIATAVMAVWLAARREPMRFSGGDHAHFAAAGVLLFSTNFVLFYYAGLTVPSGLLAVVFSLASVMNLALGALFLGQPIEPRVAAGGALGVIGVGLLFWPQITAVGAGRDALVGLAFAVGGTMSFCLGNLVSTLIQRRGVPVVAANGWGMGYGVAALLLLCLATGAAFEVEPTLRYWASLIYLAIFASVVAFACYVTLLRRIGGARAAYATVLFPVLALAISTALEGYRWTPLAVAGVVFTLAGNLIVLRPPRPAA